MVTVTDPKGTRQVHYNRSGTTIVDVTAVGENIASAVPIPCESEVTIAIVTVDYLQLAVSLPDNAQVGDVVEVHNTVTGFPIHVFPDAASTWLLYSGGNGQSQSAVQYSGTFRKVAATVWAVIAISPNVIGQNAQGAA